MCKGKVYIVGAGPGDPGLITLKALEFIKGADVILYDELANASLLSYAREGAELVYVGKKTGNHALPQDEILKLMIEKTGVGKTVCRLKGGDPFLFGRGGEEAEALAKNGIPFEIVAGVSSAISVPAYAGIPITHRCLSSGVAIFTGHEDPKKNTSDLDWKTIARLNITLVFLMGMDNLEAITDNLIREGMDRETPVAVIYRGTTPAQRCVTGELRSIAGIVHEAELTAPSVIVIGRVVGMRDALKWFEERPLFGRKILVTRSRKQARELSKMLSIAGADVYEFPTIEIEPNEESCPALDRAIRELSGFDWIIFTSANGVDCFFDRMREQGRDARALEGVRICAIGPATRERLAEMSILADVVPKEYISESILDALSGKVKGKRILIPRADIARDVLPKGLERAGANVQVIDIYRTKMPHGSGGELKELLTKVDMVTFTSASTVENFSAILGEASSGSVSGVKAASIGPVTTEAIRRHGIPLACEASEYTISGLVEAIIEYTRGTY